MSLTLALLIAAVVGLLAGPLLLGIRSATPRWKAAILMRPRSAGVMSTVSRAEKAAALAA